MKNYPITSNLGHIPSQPRSSELPEKIVRFITIKTARPTNKNADFRCPIFPRSVQTNQNARTRVILTLASFGLSVKSIAPALLDR